MRLSNHGFQPCICVKLQIKSAVGSLKYETSEVHCSCHFTFLPGIPGVSLRLGGQVCALQDVARRCTPCVASCIPKIWVSGTEPRKVTWKPRFQGQLHDPIDAVHYPKQQMQPEDFKVSDGLSMLCCVAMAMVYLTGHMATPVLRLGPASVAPNPFTTQSETCRLG